MNKKRFSISTLFKLFLVIALTFTFLLGNASDALAARTGGRIGGGSFRAPSRTYSSPSSGYRSPGYGYGGGIGFPFLLPFFGFGGGFGGLFTILIFIAVANFLVKTFRSITGSEEGVLTNYDNPAVSVGKVQVGLLASARSLQQELDNLARSADTGSAAGRAMVLQEATLAMLRHPEYWVYGATESQQTTLESAEAKYNQLTLGERSKFSEETLSNVNSQLRDILQLEGDEQPVKSTEIQTELQNGEYIIVTVIVGVEGKLELPKINDSDDLNQALKQLGSIGSDRLLAVDVLWTPQAAGDNLSTEDILAHYPNLKLV